MRIFYCNLLKVKKKKHQRLLLSKDLQNNGAQNKLTINGFQTKRHQESDYIV
jgi:hypothetical protein